MKIAIQLDDDRNIIGVSNADENSAKRQATFNGWTLVDSDPAFLISNSYLWTVRESDNVLVHKTTNQTSDEENKSALTVISKQQLAGQMTNMQLQAAVTALTKQVMQNQISTQAQIDELNKNTNTTTAGPEDPTDESATPTDDGAVVQAN